MLLGQFAAVEYVSYRVPTAHERYIMYMYVPNTYELYLIKAIIQL